MTGLAAALLAAQGEMPALHKDATNPHFKSQFVSLTNVVANVGPILNKHGIVFLQFPTTLPDGSPGLRTRLEHAETSEYVEDTMPLMLAKDDPQAQGSALTYARRYSLMAILGLVADEDDDGNGASRPQQQFRAPAQRPQAANGDSATDPQIKNIRRLINKVAKTGTQNEEQWVAWIKETYQVAQLTALTKTNANVLIDGLKRRAGEEVRPDAAPEPDFDHDPDDDIPF